MDFTNGFKTSDEVQTEHDDCRFILSGRLSLGHSLPIGRRDYRPKGETFRRGCQNPSTAPRHPPRALGSAGESHQCSPATNQRLVRSLPFGAFQKIQHVQGRPISACWRTESPISEEHRASVQGLAHRAPRKSVFLFLVSIVFQGKREQSPAEGHDQRGGEAALYKRDFVFGRAVGGDIFRYGKRAATFALTTCPLK